MAENTDCSPYSELISSVGALVEEHVTKFQQIWEEIGYDDSEIEPRCNLILQHTQQLFDEMLEEVQTTRQRSIEKVERLLVEASQLEKELGIQDLNNFDTSKLKDAESILQGKIDEYRAVKQARMDRLAEYRRREAAVCEALDIPHNQSFQNVVPTDVQFDEYERYLAEKEEEKERLMRVYRETKIAILTLIRELGETPRLNFHKLVVYEDESKFKPTKKNMEMLRSYHHELEGQLEKIKIIAQELREKLTLLWERLQEDTHHRESFLARHQGYSASTIHGMKEEVERCEELKRKNISNFVGEIRKELADWWDKCLISEEDRSKFAVYKSTTYTEDLLELHEFEVQRLKRYYEDNIHIFQLAIQRQKLWDKMLEMEDRTKDPERLFKNRGGQLLQEEQERKRIQKELPKVEKELLKYLEEYEIKHGSPFYIEGEILKDRINLQWANHKTHKEAEKSAKKEREHLSKIVSRVGTQVTATKRKHVPTPLSTSTKKRHVAPACATPLSTSTKKRHLATPSATPSSTSTKKRYVATSSSAASRLNPAWKKEVEKRTAKVRRRILDRTQLINSTADSQELAQPLGVLNFGDTTTYSDFQEHLEERSQQEMCRSSVATSQHHLRKRDINPLPKKAPLVTKNTNI